MSLYTETNPDLDLSAGGTILTYTYSGRAPRSVICRAELGSASKPIHGGTYIVRAYIDYRCVAPNSTVVVEAGVTKAMIQSREMLLIEGDVLSVKLTGDAADAAVDVTARLIDISPLTRDEVYGSGGILVDHNYGGSDNLTYRRPDGQGIDYATVQAFLKSDWAAGRRSTSYVKAQTNTTTRGRWVQPMLLDPDTYILLYFRQGSYGPDTKTVTVTA